MRERDEEGYTIGELDTAWKRANAALPEGWCLSLTTYPLGQWTPHAQAWNFNGGVSAGVMDGFGETPEAALHDLAANLTAYTAVR